MSAFDLISVDVINEAVTVAILSILIYPNVPTTQLRFIFLVLINILLCPLAVYYLALTATKRHEYKSKDKALKEEYRLLLKSTRISGTVAGFYLLSLPFFVPSGGPLINFAVRVSTFFYACKILDLTVARARRPPTRIDENGKPMELTDGRDRLEYTALLLREFRYASFNIAVSEKGRGASTSKFWTWGPTIAIPSLAIRYFPGPETKLLLALLTIQIGLEILHTLFHQGCPRPLFWQPFAAKTVSDFWAVHWHQGALPWLYSLGYVPARRFCTERFGWEAGKAAGLLATFSLSGVWHGWVVAALSTSPWRTGIGLWLVFMAHGLLCLGERAIWKEQQGGILQRLVCWSIAIFLGGLWIRDSQARCKLWWLAA